MQKLVKHTRHWAVFGHFLYCFACFQLREFKFSAIGYAKGPGCVAAFWAMTFWPPFRALADAVQIFTFSKPSWVNSSHFHIILAFWSNSTFWPLFHHIGMTKMFSPRNNVLLKCVRELQSTREELLVCKVG